MTSGATEGSRQAALTAPPTPRVPAEVILEPPRRLTPHPTLGRLRLLVRWSRFAVTSAKAGWPDFVRNAVLAMLALLWQSVTDAGKRGPVECSICGWSGRRFYPLVGPGYAERDTTCPGCLAQDRHRALIGVLLSCTDAFQPGSRVVEVAPMRSTQALFQATTGVDYTSFDIARRAMEHGDILDMRYADASVDVFICFHVLEHIQDEAGALREIRRVLRPDGLAVVQVPVDSSLATTVEYDGPDPRDVGHVRRNGRDFVRRLESAGFEVTGVCIGDGLSQADVRRAGINSEPIYLLRPTASP